MKASLLIICLSSCTAICAQQTTTYYDWQWKKCSLPDARFISNVKKTDSGWLRNDYFLSTGKLQMSGLYEDSATTIFNGTFTYFYVNQMLERTGRYVHKKLEGEWLHFYPNGIMQDSTVYKSGEPTGTVLGWYSNGYLEDSTIDNKDETSTGVCWFDNGLPSMAGRFKQGKRQGTWKYFHKNGQMAALEVYDTGKLVNRQYFNEVGVEESDTTSKDRNAQFPGGAVAWKKFILRNLEFPANYKLENTNKVTVVVSAIIDEEGNAKDVLIEIPFNKAFDENALYIFKKCPKWLPAIRYNRTVQEYIRQPITFTQPE